MLDKETFVKHVQDAYRHLYDLVYLRSHPLAGYLIDAPNRKEKAWQLHRYLLTLIDELDPGPQVSLFSPEWRRHRLMVLRYVEGVSPQEIADTLAISRRHYYREQDAAVDTVAHLLWCRHIDMWSQRAMSMTREEQPAPARMELLRQEAAKSTGKEVGAHLEQVVEGALAVFTDMAQQKNIMLSVQLGHALPPITVDHLFLRQLLIGLLGYCLEHAQDATITVGVDTDSSGVWLSTVADPPLAVDITEGIEADEQLATVRELALLNQIQIQAHYRGPILAGFHLLLPCGHQHTVLIIDDNQDVLHLFERYLVPNHYHVVTAQTAEEAVRRARQSQPDAILLDLMMPHQDGWDLLQIFRNEEATRATPVIDCSVLRQRELALAFGASAFLEKPVGEECLLSSLAALIERK